MIWFLSTSSRAWMRGTTYDSLFCCGCDIFSFDASAISTIHHSITVMVQVRDCFVILTECRFYSNKIEYILMLYVSPSMQSSSHSNDSESTKIWALNGGVRDSFFPQWVESFWTPQSDLCVRVTGMAKTWLLLPPLPLRLEWATQDLH